MATLTVQDIVIGGITPSFAAVASSDQFPNNGRCFAEVKNAGGTQDVVTITSTITVGGLTVQDPTVTVPITTGDKMFGPFPTDVYNDSNGLVTLAHSFTTSVTCGIFRM